MASLVDTRPATTAGTLTALPAAVAALVIALGWWNPSDGELAAVLGAVSAIAAILGKFVASVVYCRATVKTLLPTEPPVVAPGSPATVTPLPVPTAIVPAVTGGTPASLEAAIRSGKVAPFPPPPPPPAA